MAKYVYFFGGKSADGNGKMKELLGGKGANLAEMCVIGIPVPPGFTITTEVCAAYYQQGKKIPEAAIPQINESLAKMEAAFGGKKFGDPADPLLVSVRSGAALSMPGMMNTILNLGLTDASVEGLAKKTGNARFAYDSYRRVIDMFGSTAMDVEHEEFEHEIHKLKQEKKVALDTDLTVDDLKELVKRYKAVYKKHVGDDFPQDPRKQLMLAINAVFNSWNGNKAIQYRRIERITGLAGTAVNVQAMVFGNMGDSSGTGVAFTRDPNTGENVFYGDYLINAQGEDVVAGIRTPEPIAKLNQQMPKVYAQLCDIREKLEKHYKEMQDIEFTVQEGTLYMLQTRTGKRTGTAAVRIAVELVKEKLIDEATAVKRVAPDSLNHLLLPQLDPKATAKPVAQGIAASPGAATGKIVLSAEAAVEHAAKFPNDSIMLVRKETSPEDVAGMHLAKGILTSTGGKASHAAVVARGWGKPCVVGCEAVKIDEAKGTVTVAGQTVKAGDFLTINGTTGDVMIGKVATVAPTMTGDFATLMTWADKVRKLKIRTNADTPADAAKAREFGAEGIGLCRTEHMFFGEDRIVAMREMILAPDEAGPTHSPGRRSSRFRRLDFVGIFDAMAGLPGHNPPARPAAARVFAARRQGTGRSRQGDRRLRGQGEGARGRAARVQPDDGLPRVPIADCLPGDRRHASACDHRGGDRGEKARQGSPPRDHDPARRRRRGAHHPQETRDHGGRGMHGQGGAQGRVPDRHDDRAAAGRLDGGQDRRRGGVLLLRDQRPDPDDLRLSAATTSRASCRPT